MTGQLVIAELGAFKTVLKTAEAPDCDKVRSWCRSTITNALHRVGPTELMKAAAERAFADADAFATSLATQSFKSQKNEQARKKALDSLEILLTTVRDMKAVASL